MNAIVIDPKNHRRIFAATDNGVYQSKNSGTKWTDFSNGLPNAVVGDMILHERRRVLRIGTHNRGAWEVDIQARRISAIGCLTGRTSKRVIEDKISTGCHVE